ncbi:MAG TPA: hypothetical protein VFU15_05330 [Bacteroidia bacterium]|nr:hypothetical protein [Bacteroidia bacterium]
MKPAPDLFNLVHSLDKFEKRYVTLFLSSGFYRNNKSSLALFRAISRQKEFDETALKKQLGRSVTARFSAEKNKLFDLILESMFFLYRDSSPERKIVRERLRAWFLFQKGLKQAGWKYFHRAVRLAESYEITPQLAMLAYQQNQEVRLSAAEDALFSSAEFHRRDERLTRGLSEDLVLHTLFTEMIQVQKHHGEYTPAAEKEFRAILRHPLLKPSRKLISFSAQMSRIEIRSLYYSMRGDHDKAYECFVELIAAMETSETYIHRMYVRYVNALSNQLMHAVLSHRYEVVPGLVEKTMEANRGILDYFSYDIVYNEIIGIRLFELVAYKNRADTAKGPAMMEYLEKMFARYRPQMRDTLVVGYLFLFGVYHFYLGDRKKALLHLNDLVDSTGMEAGLNFQCMARLVRLVIFYELGDAELVNSQCQSVQRLLRKHGRLGAFEQALLVFLRKTVTQSGRPATQKLLSLAHRLAPGSYSYGAWSDFEFGSWLKSRIEKRPLRELIAARLKGKGK